MNEDSSKQDSYWVASHIWTGFVLGEDKAFEADVGRIGEQVGLNRLLRGRLREMWKEKVRSLRCYERWCVWGRGRVRKGLGEWLL